MKTVTHSEQKGLSQARISGWKAATGDVVAILDAHIEVHVKWCETAQLTSVFGYIFVQLDEILCIKLILHYWCKAVLSIISILL